MSAIEAKFESSLNYITFFASLSTGKLASSIYKFNLEMMDGRDINLFICIYLGENL